MTIHPAVGKDGNPSPNEKISVGRPGAGSEKSGRRRVFLNLLVPILMSLIPLAMLEMAWIRHSRLVFEKEQVEWTHLAGNVAAEFLDRIDFESRMNRKNLLLQRLLLKDLSRRKESAFQVSGEMLGKAIRRIFPPRFMVPGTLVAGFSISRQGRITPLRGGAFDSRNFRLKLLGEVLAGMISTKPLSSAARLRLDGLCSTLFGGEFGPLYKFDLLSNAWKGRITPVYFEGKSAFLLVDFLKTRFPGDLRERPIAGYFMVFPRQVQRTSRGLQIALGEITRLTGGKLAGFMVPSRKGGRRVICAKEMDLALRKNFSGFISRRLEMRDGLADIEIGVPQEFSEAGLRILRRIVGPQFPYELWLVSRYHPAKENAGGKNFRTLAAVFLILGWGIFGFRTLTTGAPLPLSLGGWFRGFLFSVGLFPILALYSAGFSHIEWSTFRKTQIALKESMDRLEEIDEGSGVMLARFGKLARRCFSDPTWAASIAGGNPRRIERAGKKAISFFQRRRSPVPLDSLFIYPFGGTNLIVSNDPKREKSTKAVNFFFPYVAETVRILHPKAATITADIGVMPGRYGEMFLGILQAMMGPDLQSNLLLTRGKAEFIHVGEERFFHIQDMVASGSEPGAWVFFRAKPQRSLSGYLKMSVNRLRRASPKLNFTLGEVRPGGQEPLVPRKDQLNSWNSEFGRKFSYLLDLAARTHSKIVRRVFLENGTSHMLIAMPSELLPGFVLGSEVDEDAIARDGDASRKALFALCVVLCCPMILLAMAVSRFLIIPLSTVEMGIEKVTCGDLSIRVALDRDDEMGEMTRAFDSMVLGLKERERLGRFVSGTLERSVSRQKTLAISTPVVCPAAVLVSDIRDFTALSERFPAPEIVAMLNRHLDAMAQEIELRGGTIEKFVGDAVVALFEGKTPHEACEKAVSTGVAMTRSHLAIQRERLASHQFTYRMGIGIDFGDVLTGTLTSSGRLEQAIVGKPRNHAENLECLSKKGRRSRIIVSTAVAMRLPERTFEVLSDGTALELARLEV